MRKLQQLWHGGLNRPKPPKLTISASLVVLLLAGCTAAPTDSPVYVPAFLPEIPAECSAACPAEPKLPEQDIDDLAAVKDRVAMKAFGRCERHKRRVCAERLKVVLPGK